MKKYNRRRLNIPRLLALGLLDIRGTAAANKNLSANEYFSRIERFIEDAPKYREMLENVGLLEQRAEELRELEAKLGIDRRSIDFTRETGTLEELRGLKSALSDIGCDKIDFYIDAVCLAIKNGNLRQAKEVASEAAVKLNALFDGLESVFSRKSLTDSPKESAVGGIPLSQALKYFDYEEEHRKLRILAVDDVSVVLNTLTSVLSPHYEVFALKDSTKVEAFLSHTAPELFLLDIEMGGVNGFDLVPLIRRFEEHKDTPIIFLTGNASLDNLKDAIALGACDFISKPVDKEVLLNKIERNIVRKKAF